MWPFKSNIPTLEQITTENDGNTITVVLSKGAHKFSKEEVLDLRLKSDVFSPKIKNNRSFKLNYFLNLQTYLFPKSFTESWLIENITLVFFGGFLNLFILYFYSLNLFDIRGSIMLCALPLTLICTICVYLIFIYLLKYFQVAKRKDHPGIDLYFEDIVTISLNNCVIQFRMTDQNLGYFYDTSKDATIFGFLINKRKKLLEKEGKHGLGIFGWLFLLLIAFMALYFFWETPFWFYNLKFIESELFKASAFYQSHDSTFQFFNYYRSDEISFLRAFFDGMVSNLILISIISIVLLFFGLMILLVSFFAYFFFWPSILSMCTYHRINKSKRFNFLLLDMVVMIVSMCFMVVVAAAWFGLGGPEFSIFYMVLYFVFGILILTLLNIFSPNFIERMSFNRVLGFSFKLFTDESI